MNRPTSWRRPAASFAAACLLLASVGLAACSAPAPVVQGKVLAVDSSTVRVQDETRPDTAIVIDIATAELGSRPAVGDLVRIVYRETGGTPRALAVMNLTRQERTEARSR